MKNLSLTDEEIIKIKKSVKLSFSDYTRLWSESLIFARLIEKEILKKINTQTNEKDFENYFFDEHD